MIFWLKTRQVRRLAVGTIACLIATTAVGTTVIPLPSLAQQFLRGAPMALVIALVPVSLLIAGLTNGPRSQEGIAVRPVACYDLALVAGIVLAALAVGLAAGEVQPLGPAVARNIAGYTGIALVGLRFFGPHAAMVLPSGAVFALALIGARGQWWAWPLADPSASPSWLLASLTLLFGVASYVRPQRSRRA